MATVQLSLAETRERALPEMCIHCGMSANFYRTQTFCCVPGSAWIFLPLLGHHGGFVAAHMRKEMRVSIPLCEDHRAYGAQMDRRNAGRVLLFFVVCLALFGLTAATAVILRKNGSVSPDVSAWIGLGAFFAIGAFGFVGMFVLIGLGQRATVRPTSITDDSITLVGVAEVFAKAVEERRSPQAEWPITGK
jgi:hypothetical protein